MLKINSIEMRHYYQQRSSMICQLDLDKTKMLSCLDFMLCFGGFKVVESSFMIVGFIMWCFIQFNLYFMSYLEQINLIVKCLHFKFDFMVLLFLVFGFIKCCYPISAADLLSYFIKMINFNQQIRFILGLLVLIVTSLCSFNFDFKYLAKLRCFGSESVVM